MKYQIIVFFLLLPFLSRSQYEHLGNEEISVLSEETTNALLRAQSRTTKLMGFIDTLGEIQIPFTYRYVNDFSEDKAAVQTEEKKWYYIGSDGAPLNDSLYDYANRFKNGYAVVDENNLDGVINDIGEYLIPPAYKNIYSKNNMYFIVKNDSLLQGMLDQNNNFIFPLKYKKIRIFKDSIVFIQQDDLWAIGKLNGELSTDFIYTNEDLYSDNYLGGKNSNSDLILVHIGKYKGYINSSGNTIIPTKYDNVTHNADLIRVKLNNKFGLFNKMGEMVLPIEFDDVSIQDHNLFIANNEEGAKLYFDNGTLFTDEKHDINNYYFSFHPIRSNHLVLKQDEKYALVDIKGKFKTAFEFNSIEIVNEELIIAKRDTFYGIINSNGDEVFPFNFDKIKALKKAESNVRLNYSGLIIMTKGEHKGVVNEKGELVAPIIHKTIKNYNNGCVVLDNNKSSLINDKGEILIPPLYESLECISLDDDFVIAEKEEKFGIINFDSEIIIPFEYEELDPILAGFSNSWDGNFISAKKNGLWGLINLKEEVLVPFEYSKVRQNDQYNDKTKDKLWNVEKSEKVGIYHVDKGIIVPIKYDYIFKSKLLLNGKEGLIFENGEISEPIYDEIIDCNGDYIIAKNDGNFGLLTSNKILLDFEYDDMEREYFGRGIIITKDSLKSYYSLEKEKLIFEFEYSNIWSYYSDRAIVLEKNGKRGLYSIDKGLILDFEYDDIKVEGVGITTKRKVWFR